MICRCGDLSCLLIMLFPLDERYLAILHGGVVRPTYYLTHCQQLNGSPISFIFFSDHGWIAKWLKTPLVELPLSDNSSKVVNLVLQKVIRFTPVSLCEIKLLYSLELQLTEFSSVVIWLCLSA